VTRPFVLDLGWGVLLTQLEIDPDALLRAAHLPADLFQHERPTTDPDGLVRLWRALEAMIGQPAPGLLMGESLPVEALNPPLFAALCSPNFKIAAQRISLFKPLMGPCRLDVTQEHGGLSVSYVPDAGITLPPELFGFELAFLIALARRGTRSDIQPLRVEFTVLPEARPYEAFFGVKVRKGSVNRIVLSNEDAERPFLGASPSMFAAFEPALRRQLEEVTGETTLNDRLRAALVEALPSGRTAVADVAPRLGLSTRSLQRKLRETGTSYQSELQDVRKQLAMSFLQNTTHSCAEIAFLLGYCDPNSFFRAFQAWTGTTPEAARRSAGRERAGLMQ